MLQSIAMLIVIMMGRWSDIRLCSVLDTVLISGEDVCWCVVFWNFGLCICV